MKRNNVVLILSLIIFSIFLSSCGKTDTKDNLNDTEVKTEDTVQTENSIDTESISYVETDSAFRVKNIVDIDKTLADGKTMDWTKWERLETHILLKESIDIYDANKSKVGYTKENINAVYVAVDGEWSHLAIGESGSSVYVRTDELLAVMLENENTENVVSDSEESTETSQKVDSEPTYTIIDMAKTLYAKQNVNLRSGPSTDYEKVGSLTTNQEVQVTGQADTGWYRIVYNGGVAYVSNNYLSDAKVEIASSSADGNTNDSGDNYMPPTDDNMDDSIFIPEESEPIYTADEVIAIVESKLRAAGFTKPEEHLSAEELAKYGPTDGMSWGLNWIPMNDPYYIDTFANGIVEGFQYNGYGVYYIEYIGIEDNSFVIKIYYGPPY